jgi:hypothetical protein
MEPIREHRSMPKWLSTVLWFHAGCGAMALPIMLIQIEWIIPMGVFFSSLAIFLAVAAHRNKQPRAAWIGLSSLGYCIVILLLINILEWSPDDARIPVPILSGSFVVSICFFTWFTLKSDRARALENDADLGNPSPHEGT